MLIFQMYIKLYYELNNHTKIIDLKKKLVFAYIFVSCIHL